MHRRRYVSHRHHSPRQAHHRSGYSGRGRGGSRARRGDVRAAVLALLAEQPMHGYEMIKEIEERSGGYWRPSAGSIYPTLQLLEDEGLIAGTESEGKRRFELTDEGKAAVEERARSPTRSPGSRFAPAPRPRSSSSAARPTSCAPRSARRFTPPTRASAQQVRELLDETRRGIYAILGGAGVGGCRVAP